MNLPEPADVAGPAAIRRQNTYTQDAIWTLAGNVVYAAAAWGVVSVVARLGTPEMVGQFVLALALIAPVLQFAGLQLQTVLATDARDEFRFSEYFRLRMVASALGAAFIVALTLFQDRYRVVLAVVVIVLASRLSENISDLYYGLFQKHRRLDLAGKSRMIRAVLGVTALAAGLSLTGRLVVGLAGLAGVWTAMLVLFDRPRAERFASVPAARPAGRLWRLMRLGFPLGLTLGLTSLIVNVPRYLLEGLEGLEALGYYSAMVFFNIGLAMVSQAACQAASARLAVHFIEDLSRFMRLVRVLLMLMLVAAAAYVTVVAAFGEAILRVAYGSDYAGYAGLFWVVALAGAVDLLSGVAGYSLTAARYFAIQPVLKGATVLVCLVTVYVLTRRYGMTGTAWGSLIASTFSLGAGGATLAVVVRRAKTRRDALSA